MDTDIGFSEDVRSAVAAAVDAMRALGHSAVDTEHLLLGLVRVRSDVLPEHCVPSAVEEAVRRSSPRGGRASDHGEVPCAPAGVEVLRRAIDAARDEGAEEVRPVHLLAGLLREGSGVASRALRELGVDEPDDGMPR